MQTENLSKLEIHKLTQEQYDRLANGEITGKSINENALYMTSDDVSSSTGSLSIENGGTGATTAEEALINLGAAAKSHTHSFSDISGAAPAYTYGTEDLTAGTSTLETGKLYFVYE